MLFNGNKRTAVIALDLFLTLNGCFLTMKSDEVYELAKRTVIANMTRRSTESVLAELVQTIQAASFSFELLNHPDVQQRLGADYAKIASRMRRIAELALKMTEIGPPKPRRFGS